LPYIPHAGFLPHRLEFSQNIKHLGEKGRTAVRFAVFWKKAPKAKFKTLTRGAYAIFDKIA
jgi:hypothetical protein